MTRPVLGTFATLAAAALLHGCTTTSQVTWEPDGSPRHDHPHQSWWNYEVVYHPNVQAYYSPYSERYYWFRDGTWWQGETLPSKLTPDPRTARVVKLQQPTPWIQHESSLAWHPAFNDHTPAAFDPTRHESRDSRYAGHSE